jgi:hypothetical protein
MRGNSNAGYNSPKFLPGIYLFEFISELISENKETLLINFRSVVNVFFLLGDSPAFEFSVPTFRNNVSSS